MCNPGNGLYTVLYADDIILLAPSVVSLEKLLHNCELELNWLDIVINSKKSFCLRVGPRYDVKCCKVVSSTGKVIPWCNEIRYSGIYIIGSKEFKSVSYTHLTLPTKRIV